MTQPKRISVVVLGGINMDLVTVVSRFPEAGETVVGSRFLTYPGGKGANQAVAAARMGAGTLMVGKVGDDIFGPQLTEALASGGVDVSGVAVESGISSGLAVINIDASSQNRIVQILGANETCGETEKQRVIKALREASVLLQLEVSVDLSLTVAQEAAARGKTVVLDPGPVRPLPKEFYSCCHVITPNETEAPALVGFPVTDLPSAARAARLLVERGVQIAVIKLGCPRRLLRHKGGRGEHIPAIAVDAVDSVAAGDAFNGALAASMADGEELAQAIRKATAAGALAVTKFGAQDSMPTRADVEQLLLNRGI